VLCFCRPPFPFFLLDFSSIWPQALPLLWPSLFITFTGSNINKGVGREQTTTWGVGRGEVGFVGGKIVWTLFYCTAITVCVLGSSTCSV